MEKKSGFLAEVTTRTNTVVYYQCKSCLSFLASTAKWDRHLSTCFSQTGNASRPAGFRMVPFKEPVVSIEKVEIIKGTKSPNAGSTSSSYLPSSSLVVKRGRGRPRKIQPLLKFSKVECNQDTVKDHLVENGYRKRIISSKKPVKRRGPGRPKKHQLAKFGSMQNAKTVSCKKRGRPRKVLTSTSNNQDNVAANFTEDSAVVGENRKSDRPRKERSLYMASSFSKKALIKARSRKKVRAVEQNKVASKDEDWAEKKQLQKTKRSTSLKGARKRKPVIPKDPLEVRSYKFQCKDCPGRFDDQRQYNLHVNGVHGGTRRLMTCCVCRRVFNKRDSLNQHYLAHEAAEAREVTFNLFKPWDDAMYEKLKVYRASHNPWFNKQQTCKACLLQHYTHHSFVTHFRQEHADPPESYTLDCLWCSDQFKTIKVYLEHAKSAHTKNFFGGLTLLRQKSGIFVGNRVAYQKKDPEELKRLREARKLLRSKKPRKKKATQPKVNSNINYQKRPSSFMPKPVDDEEGSDWEKECGISRHELERSEIDDDDDEDSVEDEGESSVACNPPVVKKVEIEKVHLIDSNVKEEPIISSELIEIERKDEIIIPDLFEEEEQSISPAQHDSNESEPVAFGIIKGELV